MLIVNCRFLSQKITGTQKFAVEICRELKKQDNDILFLSNPNILQKEIADELEVKIIGQKSYKLFKFFRLPSGIMWEQFVLPFYIKKHFPKAPLLSLINLAPIFYQNNAVVLHDLAFKRYPEFFKKIFLIVYNLLVPIILKRAKIIFTVSEFSKLEIVNFFKVDASKVEVIYNAVNDIREEVKKEEIIGKYILAVGSIEPRKNIVRLIQAVSKQDKLKLIVVGEQNSHVFSGNIDIKETDTVEFTGYIDESELNKLYSNATLFIYPSLYEGFGIPPLEAQSLGTPVVLSDIEVFHEIYGDSAFYIDPYDVQSMQVAIKKISEDEKLRKVLIKNGYKNIEKYSWPKSAQKILKCLR